MTGVYLQRPGDELPHDRYDYVIVGAGIYGLPLGAFLRQLVPEARVAVLEDNTIPGEGITVNTGGIIRSCYSNTDVMAVAAFGRPYFADPSGTLQLGAAVQTGFIASGWARFVNEAETPGIVDEIERIVQAAQHLGVAGVSCGDLERFSASLSPPRRANLARIMDLDDITHVLEDELGGYADGGSSLLAFLEAALDRGVDVVRLCHVDGFLRDGDQVCGVRYRRWRSARGSEGEEERETVSAGELRCRVVIISAGAGSRRLIERECSVKMPTYPTYHQTPLVENTASLDLTSTVYQRQIVTADLPVISHWRDLYFHPEGPGVVVGAHHRELHDEDYVPAGGKILLDDATIEVGLSQVLLDKILASMEHLPVLATDGLRLGRRPDDIPGGFYVMNPEELPFEGVVPGTGDALYYIGSGSGTGFKLGPGLAYLLAQRIAGVPREERLITSSALSAERSTYFYPATTTDAELRSLFDPAAGRFRHVGASGVREQHH